MAHRQYCIHSITGGEITVDPPLSDQITHLPLDDFLAVKVSEIGCGEHDDRVLGHRAQDLQSVYNEITNIDLEKTICQGSQLSIFTILKSIRIVVPKGVKGMVDQLEPGLKSIDQILKKFVRFDTKGLNLNVKIPEYYRTAKTAYDERKTQVYFVFILVLFVFD